MNCLVLGNHTQGLGILRSLGTPGVKLHLINDREIALARFSRHLSRYHRLPRQTLRDVYIRENTNRLVAYIRELVPEGARWPVFCINEDLVNFLHCNRKSLKDRLSIPANPITDIIDKYRFARHIRELGIDSPQTYLLSDFDPARLESGAYLCKGRLGNRFRNLSRLKGMHVGDVRGLESIRKTIEGEMSPEDVLVQEKLPKNDAVVSCCGFSVDGHLFCHFQYVKLRQHPDEFGTGTFLKSIYDERLLDISRRIIGHFGYTGIFEIEFLRDGDRYTVIEMNPRTWKSIHFATLCGQNMCAAYAGYCRSGSVLEPELDFEVGKTWVDLGTDIPMLFKNRSWAHAGYNRDTFYCVLSLKDPGPFMAEILLAPFIALGI